MVLLLLLYINCRNPGNYNQRPITYICFCYNTMLTVLLLTVLLSGGDQLTRVRFTSGRKLRAGAHTAKDRLEHTHPDVIELFHTKQAVLTVSTCTKWT